MIRVQFANDTRIEQKDHIAQNATLEQYLRAVPEAGVAAWMTQEVKTNSGASLLYRRFVKKIRQVPPDYIIALLLAPLSDAPRGSVRADLYYNWHCAKYGAIRFDLLDDMLHILQAMYCDLFVTEDQKHAKLAALLVTSRTRVAIYPNRRSPVDQWLLSLL